METSLPFYHCTPEDQIAFLSQNGGKLDIDGIVSSSNLGRFDESLLELDESSIKKLQLIFKQTMHLKGRCESIPLSIDVSMEELALSINQAAQDVFNQSIQMIFDGGGIWKVISPTVYRILNSWYSDLSTAPVVSEYVSPHFRFILEEMDPNDYDWKFFLKSNPKENWNSTIVEKGVVDFLAKKFQARLINPNFIELQLTKYKRKVSKLPANTYISQVFKEHPQIAASRADLHRVFIKAFGFLTAAEIEDRQKQVCFSLRTIGNKEVSHDCLFAVKTNKTITPINSLFFEVTPSILNKGERKFYLESYSRHDIQAVFQAISDRNLMIFTFDELMPANRTDFARTMSLFSSGGRCYQRGWFNKIDKAIEEEVQSQKLPHSKVWAKQLIDRVNLHHQKQLAALIVLTFNASAYLLWRDVSHKTEIQKLWQLIFTYIDSIDEECTYSHHLIECIQMLMRDPTFNFEDLYAQVQASSFIEQNGNKIQKNCPSEPTQTEHFLFTQVRLAVPSHKGMKSQSILTLFFPFDLAWAIKHMSEMAENAMLVRIHTKFVGKNLSFGLGKSRLSMYAPDPRRQFSLCTENVAYLMEQPQEQNWFMGFLISLSLLAQKEDQVFLKKTLRSVISMLFDQWPSVEFKQNVLDLLEETLKQSGIALNRKVLNELFLDRPLEGEDKTCQQRETARCIQLIAALMNTHWDPLAEISLEYLDKIDEELDHSTKKELYNTLLKSSLSGDSSSERKVHQRPLSELMIRIGRDETFDQEMKLNWLITLHALPKVALVPELEDELFRQLLNIMESIDALSENFRSRHLKVNRAPILEGILRLQQPFKVLSFFQEICRLRLLDDVDQLRQFWDRMLAFNSSTSKLTYVYQESCLTIAQKFGYWEHLTQNQKDSFQKMFLQTIEQCFYEFEGYQNGNMIIKLNSLRPNEYKDRIDQFLHKFLRYKLAEWKGAEILDEDYEVLFALTEMLARSQDPSAGDLLRGCLKQISKLPALPQHVSEVRRILENYLKNHAKENASQLINFLFIVAEDMRNQVVSPSLACSIYSLVLEFVFILQVHPERKNELNDRTYIQFHDYFLKSDWLANSNYPVMSLFKKHSTKFLQELHRRKLWMEVVRINRAFPLLQWKNSLEEAKIYVWALSIFIQNPDTEKEEIRQLGDLLDAIHALCLQEVRLQVQIKDLYLLLFNHCLAYNDYPNARHWLEKEKLCGKLSEASFYQRAFSLLLKMVNQGILEEAGRLMIDLSTPPRYEKCWIKIFLTLLKKQQIAFCLLLIRNKKPLLGMKNEKFKSEWIQIVQDLLENIDRLSIDEKGKISRNEQELQNIVHELIWHCFPTNPNIWSKYIDVYTRKSSQKIVENIFNSLIRQSVLESYLEKEDQISCWKWLLQRLMRDGSELILDEKWWLKAWKAFEEADEKERQELLMYFIRGASKAFQNRISSEQKKKQAKKMIAFLEKDEKIKRIQSLPLGLLDLAGIFIAANDQKNLLSAIYCATEAFFMVKCDPIVQVKVVQIMNLCLKKIVDFKDEKSVCAMGTLIRIVQQSRYCQDADQFNILRYWHAVEDHEAATDTRLSSKKSNAAKYNKLFLTEKRDALSKIINNPWKSHHSVSKEDIAIVRKTILQFYHTSFQIPLEFLQDCFNHKNFDLYADEELKKKIYRVKYVPRRSWIDKKFNEIVEQPFQKIVRAKRRYRILRDYNRKKDFQPLDEEEEAFFSCCKLVLSVVVTSIALLILSFYPSKQSDL